MPITYGSGSTTDWGLLTALQGQDNWQQKRQDRAADMRYAQANQQLAAQQLQDEITAGKDVLDPYLQAQKVRVLDPDIIKIREKNDALINPIKEGIKKFNGDVNLYLKSGGYNDLMKYNSDLFNSPEMKGAVRRMTDYGEMQKDMKEGKILRPITEDINGSKQRYDPKQKMDDFLGGKASDFQYDGGYKPFEHDYRKSFAEVYGSGDKYKPQTATRQDVYNMALYEAKQNGLSSQDGMDYSNKVADEYESGVKSGKLTPYLYKFDDSTERNLKIAQTGSANRSNRRAKSGSGRGANDDDIFWVQNVNAGGVNRDHALGYLAGATNANGTVVDVKSVVTENLLNPTGVAGAIDPNNPQLQNKIQVTYTDKDGRKTEKIYDTTNTGDVAELQSLKESQKGKGDYIDEWDAFVTTKQGEQNTPAKSGEKTYKGIGKDGLPIFE